MADCHPSYWTNALGLVILRISVIARTFQAESVSGLGRAGAYAGLHEDSELLRFTTAGSVDDGKSTLIGRLLYDTKTVFEDQLQHVEDVSRRRGDARTNLALLTDGLRAEREQGITIDVAYRYFATPRRKFIIADTPGHIQYTRNMVTGASTANLAIVLADARQGIVEQTRRHTHIAALLRTPHLVFAVNKMDLVDWDRARFFPLASELRELASRIQGSDVVSEVAVIPISALTGANVVARATEMPWYGGPTLLAYLETVAVTSERELMGVRFPVQWVIRPQSDKHHDYRGYAGQLAGGILRRGDEVLVIPGERATKISRIEVGGREVDLAHAPMSVTVHVADDIDISRGSMLSSVGDQPIVSDQLDATVCWMAEQPLRPRARYAIKHTTRWARAIVTELVDRLDVATGSRHPADELGTNALGRVRLRTSTPIAYDPYAWNRVTGSFILVDEATNATVAAGMLIDPQRRDLLV